MSKNCYSVYSVNQSQELKLERCKKFPLNLFMFKGVSDLETCLIIIHNPKSWSPWKKITLVLDWNGIMLSWPNVSLPLPNKLFHKWPSCTRHQLIALSHRSKTDLDIKGKMLLQFLHILYSSMNTRQLHIFFN